MSARLTIRAALHAAILCLCAAAAACARAGGDGSDEGEGAAVRPTVAAQTALVVAQPFTEAVGAIGSVTPRAGHVATMSAPAGASAARVTRVLVAVGDRVAAGEPLVELDASLFRATAQSAEAALAAAERSWERTRRLADEGIAPRKDADQAAADLARARADAMAARRSAQLATLRSPIAGVVTRMSAVLGATADPSQPLVEVADPGAVDVLLAVTPRDAARVRAGAEVALSAGQSAAGERLGTGRVAAVAGAVDSATRSVAVRVEARQTSRPLRIGETVFGQVTVATTPDAVTVPLAALVPDGEGFKVFVVDASGTAHERPVTVGGRDAKVAEIREGLRPGERVVTTGAYGVEDSAKVVPVGPAPAKGTER